MGSWVVIGSWWALAAAASVKAALAAASAATAVSAAAERLLHSCSKRQWLLLMVFLVWELCSLACAFSGVGFLDVQPVSSAVTAVTCVTAGCFASAVFVQTRDTSSSRAGHGYESGVRVGWAQLGLQGGGDGGGGGSGWGVCQILRQTDRLCNKLA
jgi:uncharacterized membrane protein YgcG